MSTLSEIDKYVSLTGDENCAIFILQMLKITAHFKTHFSRQKC